MNVLGLQIRGQIKIGARQNGNESCNSGNQTSGNKKIKALKDFPPESEVFLIAELLIAKKQIKDILQSW